MAQNTAEVRQSLIRKIAEACDEVGGVEKKGRNEFQRYNYVKAADVAAAIRHKLFKRGVVVLQHEKSFHEIAKVATNSGNTIALMQLDVDFILRDADSDESITVQAFGVAMDSGDKAIYKCKTGATKYFLRALGLIPDEKDDPEFDESVDEATDPKVTTVKRGKNGKAEKIKEFQARAWSAACRSTGKTAEQEAKYLRVRWSAASVTELTTEDFAEAIKWAAGTEDLSKTLKASVKAAKPPQPIAEVMDAEPEYDFDQAAGD